MIKKYNSTKSKRKARVRSRIISTSSRPRLTVFRSNKHIYAQIIDNKTGKVIASASDIKQKESATKTQKAQAVGTTLAKAATKAKINQVVFDRGHYRYHGRIKALAEAAKQNGLEF